MVSVSRVPGSVALEVTIAVPPERVFRALTTAEEMSNYLSGFDHFTFEAQLGGSFEWVYGDGRIVCGEVIEFDPPRRLAFTWEFKGSPLPKTVVTFTLERVLGGTRLSFVHSGFSKEFEHMRGVHEQRWPENVSLLKRYLEAD
jgi:uncharacterized protein YndB with AHSA1/START domain